MTALKNVPSLIGGAAVLAAAAIGLTAASASAERVWDIEVYDNCIHGGYTIQTCCVLSGGDYDADGVTCAAPAAAQVDPVTPPKIANGTLPTVATNAPVTPAPGSRAPGRLPSGGVAAP
jgi:hypothetical protein